MTTMTMRDLIDAVEALLASGPPIVSSRAVKDWCAIHNVDSGVNEKGTGGGALDRASKAARKAD